MGGMTLGELVELNPEASAAVGVFIGAAVGIVLAWLNSRGRR